MDIMRGERNNMKKESEKVKAYKKYLRMLPKWLADRVISQIDDKYIDDLDIPENPGDAVAGFSPWKRSEEGFDFWNWVSNACRDNKIDLSKLPENPDVKDSLITEKIQDYSAIDETELLIEERGKIYGDIKTNWDNIGKMWTGLLQQHYKIKLSHDIPADLGCLMMVALKASRSVNGVYHKDNFDDGTAYLKMANDLQGKK